jgi:hypothetical protein
VDKTLKIARIDIAQLQAGNAERAGHIAKLVDRNIRAC